MANPIIKFETWTLSKLLLKLNKKLFYQIKNKEKDETTGEYIKGYFYVLVNNKEKLGYFHWIGERYRFAAANFSVAMYTFDNTLEYAQRDFIKFNIDWTKIDYFSTIEK